VVLAESRSQAAFSVFATRLRAPETAEGHAKAVGPLIH
jgi:hypothetical protein